MRTRGLRAALGAVLLLVLASPALAHGGEKREWEIGLYAGTMSLDSYESLDPDGGLFYGLRAGYFLSDHLSVEGSYQWFSSEANVAGPNPDLDINSLRGNALWNFRPDKNFRWFVTAGLGRETIDSTAIDTNDFSWNAGGGARWYFGKNNVWGLRADARWISVNVGGSVDSDQTNYEASGGAFWTFGGGEPKDTDADHVTDKKDDCASTPKGARVDGKGCPTDSDGDRVYDGIDKCADTPKGWAVDVTGCPADKDGDGVADQVDACPGGPPKEAKVDAKGCPIDDADGDGIWNGGDRCPDTEKGLKVDPVGCPVDADGDGVLDRKAP
jgi:OmpA-OmpF porin, OOP family